MVQYNWRISLNRSSLSLLAHAHGFCRMNKLTLSEFVRLASVPKKRSTQKASELIVRRNSTLGPWLDFNFDGLRTGYRGCAYAGRYSMTSDYADVSRHLRYCPTCLSRGWHFSWQQALWMERCVLHREAIQSECPCGKKIRYALRQKPQRAGHLCECGKLQLGEPTNLSKRETACLYNNIESMHDLQDMLEQGYYLVRLGKQRQSPSELQEADRQTRQVFVAETEWENVDLHRVHARLCFPHEREREAHEDIHACFRSYSELLRQRQSSSAFTRYLQLGSAILQRDVFHDGLYEHVVWLASINGESIDANDYRIPYIADVLAYRAVEALKQRCSFGHAHWQNRLVNAVLEHAAQPLCTIRSISSNDDHRPILYWPNNVSCDVRPHFAWVESLSEWYVTHVLYGSRGGKGRLRALRKAKSQRSYIRQFGEYFDQSAPGQLALFS